MNHHSDLSPLGHLLAESLRNIDTYETELAARRERDTVHVPTVGSALSIAYEQLRNASEYSEGDLLQQRAIRRYLKRVLSFHAKLPTTDLAEELIAELTQAEYLANDHTTKSDIRLISQHIKKYYDAYWEYADSEKNYNNRVQAQKWILDVLAVRCEQALRSHVRKLLFAHFAYTYLNDRVPHKKLVRPSEHMDDHDIAVILYAAVHRALLKSDNATIRAAVIDSYRHDIDDIHDFIDFNAKLDALFESKTLVYTTRVVSKYGAPLRFIYTGFFVVDAPLTTHSLRSPESLEQGLHQHIDYEYKELEKRLDTGIIRSIIFLLITKGIVGFTVEVPYDLFVSGEIFWVPLLINLLSPAIFIILTRLTLATPGPRNTTAVINQVNGIIFEEQPAISKIKLQKESTSVGFSTLYTLTFLVVFAGLSYILYKLDFNIVQGIIFFVFLSTASFLAFRLSRQINELEVVNTPQGALSLLRDIVYMPFVAVGQQISYRYSKVNIVAMVLDILIELPLKTILRLVRQWTQFLNEKKDELI